VVVGESLRLLHAHLAASTVGLPSYRWGLTRAEAVLNDDAAMRHVDDEGIAVLRGAFQLLTAGLDAEARPQQSLHGEPHLGNVLLTAQGPRWIDLEAACVGPVEWDLASLPSGATVAFEALDRDLLARLRVLNSARVATWCWARADRVGMRWHAQYHLRQVRAWRP
jgi:aminoglycoside/choline kinase family phosphotransferase